MVRNDGFALIHERDKWHQDNLQGEIWLPDTPTPVARPFHMCPLNNVEVFHYSIPLDCAGLKWGWIHIGLSLDTLNRSLTALYMRTLLLVAVCATLGFGISLIFANRMTKPIIALHDATIRVRDGDLTARAQVETGDEIESLALSFNEMAEALQNSQRQLVSTNEQLQTEVADRQQAEAELKTTQEKLIAAAHRAGMAEVATDILHNVGNVLNSINLCASSIRNTVFNSRTKSLKRVVDMIVARSNDLGTFITEDERGKHIPVFLAEAAKLMVQEQADIAEKIQSLTKNLQHVKQIVQAQQGYARAGGVEVLTRVSEVIEDAVEINRAGLERHGVGFRLELADLPKVYMDKQRVLQILVNLISNGKYALSHSEQQENLLIIRAYRQGENELRIEVADNGVGIAEENIPKIFTHGFTTKKHGHGFGLHSSAIAAREIGGALCAHSDGPGCGATFTVALPFKSEEVSSAFSK